MTVQKHILSVDVEDYFQVEAFANDVSRESWGIRPSRVEENTYRLLDLFDEYGAKGTFFFLGWVAERFPHLVAEAGSRGHEIACHSYWHRCIYDLTEDEFREDTLQAKNVIEKASGARVKGYRAPSWSITNKSIWAIEVLRELGFEYDSSIFPIHHDIYGIPGARRFSYKHQLQGGQTLQELPPTTLRLMGTTIPAAGGGYLRIMPMWYTLWAFDQIEAEGEQVVVYVHPWEVDPEQPRIRSRWRSRLRHYTNLRRTEHRLRQLLCRYEFQSFEQAIATRLPSPGIFLKESHS